MITFGLQFLMRLMTITVITSNDFHFNFNLFHTINTFCYCQNGVAVSTVVPLIYNAKYRNLKSNLVM